MKPCFIRPSVCIWLICLSHSSPDVSLRILSMTRGIFSYRVNSPITLCCCASYVSHMYFSASIHRDTVLSPTSSSLVIPKVGLITVDLLNCFLLRCGSVSHICIITVVTVSYECTQSMIDK
uniref:ORF39 n=1 Tax=Malaco herpesvirus 4 TaxID=3031800 RepID=A0AA48P7N6_9VIRU|nr:TPA_asm: ORF39 [Malaco herpesvirus 4]